MSVSSRGILIGSAIVAVVILVVGSFTGWLGYEILSKHAETGVVRTFASATHFPVAKVGSTWITYSDYLTQSDAQAKYLQSQEARTLNLPNVATAQMQQAVLDQLVRNAAIEQLANKYAFTVSSTEVDRAYDDLIAHAGTSTQPGEIQAYLQSSFGWTEAQFKEYIVHPALLQNGLGQKRQKDTGKEETFETEVAERLAQPDVKKWVKFN